MNKTNTLPYFSDISLLKYYKLFNKDVMFNKTVSLLLFLSKAAQDKDARKSFYLMCCFLSIHKHANEHFVGSEVYWFGKQSIFFISRKPKQMFKLFEYHLSQQDGCGFGSDMFYQAKYDNDIMLKYKNFYLRIDLYTLFLFWINLEYLRMQKYNEYAKNHFFINKSEYVGVRYHLKEGIYRRLRNRVERLRFRFGIHFQKLRYKLISVDFINNGPKLSKKKLQNSLSSAHILLTNPDLKIVKSLSHICLSDGLNQENTFFDWMFLAKISLMANYTLAMYPNRFMIINRFDGNHMFEGYNLFSLAKDAFDRFRQVGTEIYIDKLSIYVMNSHFTYNNILLENFSLSFDLDTEINLNEKNSFLYHVFDLLINDFFEEDLMDLLYATHFLGRRQGAQVASHFSFNYRAIDSRDFRGGMMIFHQYFHEHLLYGQFYKVNNFFTYYVCLTDYFYGRIWNAESEYGFLDGRLDFPYLLRKLYLDNNISVNIVNIGSLCNLYIQDNKYHVVNQDIFYEKKGSIRQEYYKKDTDTLKISSGILHTVIKDIYKSIFFSSYKFQILAHFLIFKKNYVNFLKTYEKYQNKNLKRMIMNYHNLRTAHTIYSVYQIEYRRFLNKNCLISRNNKEYELIWFSFFHRMRRAGVPKQDMAFYVKERNLESKEEIPHEDYIKSLIEKHKKRQFMALPEKYWIITDENKII